MIIVYNFIVLFLLLFFFYRLFLSGLFKEVCFVLDLRKTGVSTNGKVVAVEEFVDSDRLKTYKPKIEFLASDGIVHTFSPKFSNSIKPEIGQNVKILYKKESPDIAIADGFSTRVFIFIKAIIYIAGGGITIYFILKYLNEIFG